MKKHSTQNTIQISDRRCNGESKNKNQIFDLYVKALLWACIWEARAFLNNFQLYFYVLFSREILKAFQSPFL